MIHPPRHRGNQQLNATVRLHFNRTTRQPRPPIIQQQRPQRLPTRHALRKRMLRHEPANLQRRPQTQMNLPANRIILHLRPNLARCILLASRIRCQSLHLRTGPNPGQCLRLRRWHDHLRQLPRRIPQRHQQVKVAHQNTSQITPNPTNSNTNHGNPKAHRSPTQPPRPHPGITPLSLRPTPGPQTPSAPPTPHPSPISHLPSPISHLPSPVPRTRHRPQRSALSAQPSALSPQRYALPASRFPLPALRSALRACRSTPHPVPRNVQKPHFP